MLLESTFYDNSFTLETVNLEGFEMSRIKCHCIDQPVILLSRNSNGINRMGSKSFLIDLETDQTTVTQNLVISGVIQINKTSLRVI
jgi:hypothetical protein